MQGFKLEDCGKSLRPLQLMPQKVTSYFHRQRQRKTHILDPNQGRKLSALRYDSRITLKVNGIRQTSPFAGKFKVAVNRRQHAGTPWAWMDSLDMFNFG